MELSSKLILCCPLCPGDVLTLTTAVESLHETYPGQWITDVRTPVPAIWEHNPHVTPIADDDPEARSIECKYPTIDRSNQWPRAFVEGYTTHLGEQLGVPLRATINRPALYLSEDEKKWQNQLKDHITHGRDIPFWLINAGVKNDFTAKQWPIESYQDVIDSSRGRIQFVQIGESHHDHPTLTGCIDLRGQTNTRQLIRLAYHAAGGLGPVTFLQHLMAAWEKPYICLVGGREPVAWVQYPRQQTLHTIGGSLDCCRDGACWKSRVVPLGDGDGKDASLCSRPVIGLRRPVAQCMALIQPAHVTNCLERILAR